MCPLLSTLVHAAALSLATPVRYSHSEALTLLTLSLDCLSICMFSNGLPDPPISRSSLSVIGTANLLRNST